MIVPELPSKYPFYPPLQQQHHHHHHHHQSCRSLQSVHVMPAIVVRYDESCSVMPVSQDLTAVYRFVAIVANRVETAVKPVSRALMMRFRRRKAPKAAEPKSFQSSGKRKNSLTLLLSCCKMEIKAMGALPSHPRITPELPAS